jgi:putative restriction endonuclease
MKTLVAVTDREWFDFLRERRPDEVNFWQPSGRSTFRALEPGQPLLFKLHAPDNMIAGGGFFAHFSIIPVSLAWEAFAERNGAASFGQMRARIERYRRAVPDAREDYHIGCIILEDPFFLDELHWFPPPADFSPNIVRFKGYDLTTQPGISLWQQVLAARALTRHTAADVHRGGMYGEQVLHRPRLGQGAFRIAVTDAYERHCAVSGEKTLPVLEAAHIRPVAQGGIHDVGNGLLLRSDIHTLFDRGYVTVTSDHRFRVSRRLKDDWQNGRIYYELDNREIFLPRPARLKPDRMQLEWHSDTLFLG